MREQRTGALRKVTNQHGSRSSGRGWCRTLAFSLWLAFIGLWLCVGTALASTGHKFLSNLSEAPPGTRLLEPGSVTVDRSTGQVFVGDAFAGYVDVFSASGAYETRLGGGAIEPVGIAVDESDGDVYVAESFKAAVLAYEPDGKGGYSLIGEWLGASTPGKEFGEVRGLAVDNSNGPSAGDLYVVEANGVGVEGGVVDVFKPRPNPTNPEEGGGEEGEFLGRLSGPKLQEPNAVAVSTGTGRVLVADSVKGVIYAYSPSGVYEEKLTGKTSPNGTFKGKGEEDNVAGIAVDAGTGDIYVAEAERHAVSQYSSGGEWDGWMTNTLSGVLGEPRGVALTATGEVYVADAGFALVDRFGPGVVVPDVETGKVAKSDLTRATALLPGTVNGEGKPAEYRFEYGETEALGSETTTQSAGVGEQAVSIMIEGLQAGHTYYYRIVGEEEDVANYGLIREFETPPAVEALATGPVKNLVPESVTLTGLLKRGGLATHYYFQYGTSEAYGRQSPEPPGEVPSAKEEKEEKEERTLETSITSLSPNTLYHYRFVAENIYGPTYGEDKTFTTSGPPRITDEPTTGIGQEEATIHAKINPDQIATTYHFEYGETTAYGTEVPGASIGFGAPVAVSAVLLDLNVGTTYHFRVIAENEAGTTTGPDQIFTTVPPAPVDASYATGVSSREATLHTLINPLGHDTVYYFQYGPQSCQTDPAGCTNIPVPPKYIGAGNEDVAGEVQLSGLAPDTTYHYRVLDSNSLGATEGPEHTFTTQEEGAFALPDGRAWEMVSPPDKRGAPVEALTREGGLIIAAEDGDTLTYVVDGALGEEAQGNRSPEWQQVLAGRTANGWSSQDIATPNSQAKGVTAGLAPEYQFFTSDLSTALVEPAELGGSAEPPLVSGVTQATIYLRDNATGTFLALVSEANTAPGTRFGGHVHFVSATPDLSHVVIQSSVALTGGGSAPGLYEWSAGQLRFVSLLPGRKAASEPELGFVGRVLTHTISDDGSRIIWTTPGGAVEAKRGHLYMRDTGRGETIQLDAAKGVVEPENSSAQFQAASRDGSRIFFTDKQRLTVDSTAEPGQGNGKPDLYECEIAEVADKLTCNLEDLTVDHNDGEHASVQGLLFGTSEDSSSIYLIAQGVLAANENGNDEKAEATKNNLYELHFDGVQWTTTFVAALSSEDGAEWEGAAGLGNRALLPVRVSPNGRYLAFMSAASLTGYDNHDASPEAKGARDEEVYLYDSAAGSLRCVSCNPSGARPDGVLDANESGEGLGLLVDRHQVWVGHWLAGSVPGWTAQNIKSALFQSRYLSDEGRLYFDSPDHLVPAATNGKEDVYEYEPSGVGSCQSPSGGCVALISGGGSDRESAFIEATPTGSDAFFVTDGQLLPQDTDTAFDIYDARECTQVSPCLTPPEPPSPGCSDTETCRPALPAQQTPAGPAGTAVFSGSGNVVSQRPSAKQESQASKRASKPLTRAQKLAAALRSCRKRHVHATRKRRACERNARKLFGNKHENKKSAQSRSKARTTSRG